MPEFLKWYQKWWGVVLLVLFAGLIITTLIVSSFIIKYYWQLKQGKAGYLQEQYGSLGKLTAILQQTPVNRAELETSDDPFIGNPAAKLVIVEFLDFKCPYSRQAYDIIKKLVSNYSAKIKLIQRDFPVESLYANTSQLSYIASCAHQQGLYWPAHDILFTNRDQFKGVLDSGQIKNLVSQVAGLDYETLNTCLNSAQVKTEINKDYADGVKFGVKATPTFFINGQRVGGVISYEDWEKIIKNF